MKNLTHRLSDRREKFNGFLRMTAITFIAFIAFTSVALAQKKEAVTIYNPKADAKADIAAAVAKAGKEGKHVFLQIGGNWCIWCIRFHNLVDHTPELKKYMEDNFEVVLVNYSTDNPNEAVLASLSYPQRFGFPVFLVLDGKGKLLHTQNSAYLEEGEGHSVKKIMEFFKQWSPKALDPALYVEKKR